MTLIVQIVSAASTDQRYFVNIGGGQAQADQSIIVWGWSNIQWNDCWELTPQGMIVCAVDPQLVIGVDGDNNVITVTRDESDSSQCWTIARLPNSAACTIQNKSSLLYLTVPDSIQGGVQLATQASGSGVPEGQDWIIAPAPLPMSRQYYVRTPLDDSIESGTPYVMTASGSSAGSTVAVDTWQPCASSQLWTFNSDGTISSAVGSSLVLTASGATGGDNSTTIETAVPDNPLQVWTVNDNGTITVQVAAQNPTTQCLNVSGGHHNTSEPIITFEVQSGPPDNELWQLIPAQPVPVGTWFSLRVDDSAEGSPFVLTVANATTGTAATIAPFQPGAANQLWLMQDDGVIVSALDQTMALTADSSSDNPVTITAVQSPLTSAQQWYVQGEGLVVNYGSRSGLQYLNVQQGAAPQPGQSVITYGFQEAAPNSTWSVVPYQPQPSGQWFSIRSATVAPGSGMPYLLTARSHGQVLALLPQDSTIVADGLPGINQLWRMTLQGVIVSAVNPNLVLAVNTDGDVVLAPSSGGPDQQWAWGTSAPLSGTIAKHSEDIPCGVLQTLGGSRKVLYAGQTNNFFRPITLQAEQGSGTDDNPQTYPGQFWYVVPFLPAFDQWTTIRSPAGDGLFLQLPEKPAANVGFQASVGPQSGGLSTWQFAWPGYIVSATNPDFVLSLSTDGSSVVTYPRQPGPQPFQLWTATPEGALVNQKNGQAMTVSGTVAGSTVSTAALSGSPDKTQQWEFSPGTALQTLLVQPPVPYQGSATPGETAAYAYVDQSLGLTPDGLRAQYGNLAAPLGSYQSRLNVLPPPPASDGVLSSDWATVLARLNDELTAVIAVQTLFQQVTALYLELSQAQAMALSEVVTAAELPGGMQQKFTPKKKGLWDVVADVLEGLTYTALNVAGTFVGDPEAGTQLSRGANFVKNGLPCIANLMETGVSTGEASYAYRHSAAQEKYQAILDNIYNYEMTVLELQQALLSDFQASGAALGDIETLILSDWGKLRAVYRMIRTPGGISSLYWPSTMTPILAKRMLPGYVTGVLQALMPANSNFTISATLHTNSGAPGPTGLSSDGTEFAENNDDGTQNIYKTTASKEVMAMVWANGTDPADFFRGLNGWGVPVDYIVYYGGQGGNISSLAAGIVVTIQNFTDQKLDLTIQCIGLLGEGGNLSGTAPSDQPPVPIPPYGVRNFAGTTYSYSTGGSGAWPLAAMSGSFSVTDPAGQTVLVGKISNNDPTNNQAQYSWSVSATAPYRCVTTQDVVSNRYMYFVNIGIYAP